MSFYEPVLIVNIYFQSTEKRYIYLQYSCSFECRIILAPCNSRFLPNKVKRPDAMITESIYKKVVQLYNRLYFVGTITPLLIIILRAQALVQVPGGTWTRNLLLPTMYWLFTDDLIAFCVDIYLFYQLFLFSQA